MHPTFEDCVAVALSPDAVQVEGRRSTPRAYAVYRVRGEAGRRYRFGAHPARGAALLRECGAFEVVHLFLEREHAEIVALHLNGLPPPGARRAVVTSHPASEEAQALAFDDVEPLPKRERPPVEVPPLPASMHGRSAFDAAPGDVRVAAHRTGPDRVPRDGMAATLDAQAGWIRTPPVDASAQTRARD